MLSRMIGEHMALMGEAILAQLGQIVTGRITLFGIAIEFEIGPSLTALVLKQQFVS